MSQPQNLAGQRFGRLTAIEIVSRNPVIWKCLCDCGTIKTFRPGCLKQNTKSCGCLRKEVAAAKSPSARRKAPFLALFNLLKRRVQKRGKVAFDLSFEDFVEFTTDKKCCYCDQEIVWIEHNPHKHGSAYNLDRKDSQRGYTKTNCVVCCGSCNRIKSNIFSYEEMIVLGRTLQMLREQRGIAIPTRGI